VLVDDVAQLQAAPVGGLVELEVDRPDVVRSLGVVVRAAAAAAPLAPLRRGPAQPLGALQPLDPLVVDQMPSRRSSR